MITALVSTITGLISGALPKLVKEFTDSRNHKRELEFMREQTRLQLAISKQQGETKVAEMDAELEIAAYEAQASIAQTSLKPTGVKWVDAWNAALRPFTVTIIITLFAVMASAYTYHVLVTVEDIKLAVELLWGSLIGEAIQAVLGFLFGYRSAKK